MPTIRLKALIVDDEKAIRRFLRSTLVAEEFEVVEAETIAEARAFAEKLRPDLVVLDLGLPDGDGAELIAPFIALSKPAILVLSALDEEARKVQALNLGADDFITKPFGVAEFMARVRVALRHRVQMQGRRRFMMTGVSMWTSANVSSASAARMRSSRRASTGCCISSCCTRAR
ncbi:MAG: response regulator [Hyphomonadaceae bacterium JAD_PAG50586_4]|nr:MAG: response regulator [Hyphomonadaceae bacterium JAD_PAG50586_4]